MLIHIRNSIKGQKGFTLVELMVVVAVLGILAAIALPKLSTATDAAKDGRKVADMATVDSALAVSYAKSTNKEYPADLNTLVTDKMLNSVPDGITYAVSADKKTYNITATMSDGTTKYSAGSKGSAL